MRAALSAVSCLALIACALAADLEVGEREPGDFLVTNRFIFKPAIPGIPMSARLGATAPPSSTINSISVKNYGASDADAQILKGGVNETTVYILVMGKPGQGMMVEFTVYAVSDPPPTTVAPEDPAEPSEAPTEPEDPADSTEAPADPADPTEVPADPEDPADSTEAPADPEEPADSTEAPADPEEPADSTEAPADPEEPADPTDAPSNPEDPANPPETPADPEDPADSPEAPADPEDPADSPEAPADPEDPADSPEAPADPEDPAESPEAPAEPEDPADPSGSDAAASENVRRRRYVDDPMGFVTTVSNREHTKSEIEAWGDYVRRRRVAGDPADSSDAVAVDSVLSDSYDQGPAHTGPEYDSDYSYSLPTEEREERRRRDESGSMDFVGAVSNREHTESEIAAWGDYGRRRRAAAEPADSADAGAVDPVLTDSYDSSPAHTGPEYDSDYSYSLPTEEREE